MREFSQHTGPAGIIIDDKSAHRPGKGMCAKRPTGPGYQCHPVREMQRILLGTVALALAANSDELLCTAGFPRVYTRILTINELAPAAYYGYLLLTLLAAARLPD